MEKNEENTSELISIIIPAYNIEEYILRCLESLAVQSYRNFEAIIIDDGSQDKTGSICDKFALIDKRFRVIHRSNSGVSSTRNLGVEAAKGKYILFVDGDDYVTIDYISTLFQIIALNEVEMGCADYYVQNDNIIETASSGSNEIMFMNEKEAINLLVDKTKFQGYLWNKIFVREIIIRNKITFEKGVKIWEDMLFCLHYLTFIKRIAYIRHPIYYYVQRKGSAMNNPAIWNECTHLSALEYMWTLGKLYEGAFKEYIRDFYSNALVGLLGKTGFREVTTIRACINKINNLNGRLSNKNKMKTFLFRIAPRLMLKIYRQ